MPALAVLILLLLALSPTPARADFQVSPTLIEERRPAGSAALGHFDVDLDDESGRRFRVVVQDLRQLPTGGLAYSPPSGSPFSASSWITVTPARFGGAPDRTQPVQYVVQVPAGAEPGDHLASLTVQRLPAGEGATAAAIEAISVRVTVRVPGRARPGARIEAFDVPRIAGGAPLTLGAVVRNTGNVTLEFNGGDEGRLEIRDGGGRRAAGSFEGDLFPGETRVFSFSWQDPPLFGSFDAVAAIGAGDQVVAHESAGFWVIPWRQIGALVLIALAILVAVSGWRRRRWG